MREGERERGDEKAGFKDEGWERWQTKRGKRRGRAIRED